MPALHIKNNNYETINENWRCVGRVVRASWEKDWRKISFVFLCHFMPGQALMLWTVKEGEEKRKVKKEGE